MLAFLFSACVILQGEDGQVVQAKYYKVVHIVDGDTIDVEINGKKERVRLLGINTPESVDPRKEVECFGLEASSKMKDLVSGESVRLESDDSQANRDKYDRLLRYVYLRDGSFVNEVLVREGFAERFYSNPRCEQAEVLQAALMFAKDEGLGLWAEGACE